MESSNNIINHLIMFLVEADENSDSHNLVLKAADDLENGGLNFLNLIESMEPAMNNKSSSKRIQAMSFLSDTLGKLSKSRLSSSELQSLISFLNGRLSSDHHVSPIIMDLFLILIEQKEIKDEYICEMLYTIFREVNCQSLIMSERRTIYSIFNKCLQEKYTAVYKMRAQFIPGFVAAFDGETDPRNLIKVFSFYPFIAKTIPLSIYAEDVFEVIAAYFPINFTPPSGVTNPISNEDLTIALRECMSASESIFPFCIPFIIEKISNDTPAADIEGLKILQCCCKKYSASGLSPHLWSLLFMLYNLVTADKSKAVSLESTECIKLISAVYSREDVDSDYAKNAIETVSSLVAECLPNMISPGQHLAKPCCKILTSMGSKAKIFAELICLKTVLPLINAYKTANENSDKKSALEMMTYVINCGVTNILFMGDQFIFAQKSFFGVFRDIINNKDDPLFVTALDLFSDNVKSFTDVQVSLIMVKALKYPGIQEIQSSIERCLSSCCDHYPEITAANILDCIIPFIKINSSSMEISSYLLLLPFCCRHQLVFRKVLPLLWTGYDLGIQTEKASLPFLQIALQCCKVAYECKLLDVHYPANEWSDVNNLVVMALRLIKLRQIDFQEHLDVLSQICHFFVCRTDCGIIENLLLFLIGRMDSYPEVTFPTQEFTSMPDLSIAENVHEGYVIYPIFGIICSPSCINEMESVNMNSLRLALTNLSCFSTNSQCRETGSRAFSLLLNLFHPGFNMKEILMDTSKFISHNLLLDTLESKEAVLTFNFWSAKGLILRDFNDAAEFASMLENHLLSEEYGAVAANLYKIILQDYPDLFSKSIGSNVKFLYKQRYFQERIGSLLQQFNQSQGSARYNTQMAIIYLLPFLPNSVIFSHLSKVFMSLVACDQA